jgi:peroxiredoxin
MKKVILLSVLITFSILVCHSEKQGQNQPNIVFKNLEKDFPKWWAYYNNNIVLSSDFIAIDNFSKIISKGEFLSKLTSGEYIPLKLISKGNTNHYQLYKLDETADKSICETIKNVSTYAYNNFKMEGKAFPEFYFKDLNGLEYNNENTKGKIAVIKCWFIACKACVAEFPVLNELVEKYQNRNDIVFISLAFDQQEKLTQFLSKKPFNYAVIANQKQFLSKELGINMYPTHLIIDRNGVIRKVVNNANEMIMAFESIESSGNTKSQLTLPPPPPPTVTIKK